MTRPIRIAVQLNPAGVPDYATWRRSVLRAEELGADVIFGYDHFYSPRGELPGAAPVEPGSPEDSNFEGWTSLAAWGEITTRAEIGLLVTGIAFRNPDLLADMARTVDHISDGRLILGLGAGWFEREYLAYGYEFGTVKTRMDLFDEGLSRIVRRLELLNPPPVRQIPILIGGSGEKRTLPAVARYADIWHSKLPIDAYRAATARVDDLAQNSGRAGDEIERSVSWEGEAASDEYRDAGATLFIIELWSDRGGFDFTTLEQMLKWRDARSG
ncbi:LLM class F420-dependent oxidoreductase [Mycolicibacterium sp.]|uniref:LLM class F420-dependent oxidoreductase n=1 Tax=Mycolicibacterium sp. TaxID=2320850 RepID=UPI003D0986E2